MRCLNSNPSYIVHSSIGRKPEGYKLGAYIICSSCCRASIIYVKTRFTSVSFKCSGCTNDICVDLLGSIKKGVEKIDIFV